MWSKGVLLVLTLTLAALTASAQRNSSSKIRPGDHSNAVGNELGEKPEAVLKLVKFKGRLSAVDTKERTVTVSAGKDEEEETLKLTFSQPAGREQIKVSKKAEKATGKKRLKLEELEIGSEVSLQYYPALGQMLELTVEEHPSRA
jgi:hypothetical protein